MGLKQYRAKRQFKKTPEPKGKVQRSGKALRFCIHKHAARRLHYDVRLELDGVLVSWAVPKGPSLNPKDKRLAIKVEDHPLSYIDFEGVIPKGEYGAGTVEIWDAGTYEAAYSQDFKESQQKLRKGLEEGHLEVVFSGNKLQGKFAFIKLKNSPQENAWLLFKIQDTAAKTDDSNPIATSMPTWVSPMLAQLVAKPIDSDDWLYEVKWDGYRALAFVNKKDIQLYSRNKISFNSRFSPIVNALEKLNTKAIFDGEIVALNDKGQANFELLKNYQRNKEGILCYCIFDLLYYQGEDLRNVPLIERKKLLKQVLNLAPQPQLQFSDHIEDKGSKMLQEAVKMGLEGIMGKRKQSAYLSKRSSEWIKIKTSSRQEVVIGGYTKPKGSRKKFGALLLGIYEGDQLIYIGHVGTGFTEKTLEEVFKTMQPLVQKKCPFSTTPKPNEPATWIKPKLICEVSFAEWTKDKKLRQPVFHDLREDKKAQEVIQETPVDSTVVQEAAEEDVSLTNLDKVFWKKEHITKGDMIEYYRAVAKYMLPHLHNHPTMLVRYPNGIEGSSFHQKNMTHQPSWVKTAYIKETEKGNDFVVIEDLNTLLYVANLGAIEIHPLISQVDTFDNPAFLAIDLDPEDVPFKKVVELALDIHTILDKLKIPNYCKTSGGNGLHIYIPLQGRYPFSQIEPFAKMLAMIFQEEFPDLISLERSPKKRQKKVYFDYIQNQQGRAMIAPYSLRAKPNAPVSTPLDWSEVKPSLDPNDFNLHTIPARLKKKGDPFQPVLKQSLDLAKTLQKLEKYYRSR